MNKQAEAARLEASMRESENSEKVQKNEIFRFCVNIAPQWKPNKFTRESQVEILHKDKVQKAKEFIRSDISIEIGPSDTKKDKAARFKITKNCIEIQKRPSKDMATQTESLPADLNGQQNVFNKSHYQKDSLFSDSNLSRIDSREKSLFESSSASSYNRTPTKTIQRNLFGKFSSAGSEGRNSQIGTFSNSSQKTSSRVVESPKGFKAVLINYNKSCRANLRKRDITLKLDGTPDMRYKVNQTLMSLGNYFTKKEFYHDFLAYQDSEESEDATGSEEPEDASSSEIPFECWDDLLDAYAMNNGGKKPVVTRKKDGTPDMRYSVSKSLWSFSKLPRDEFYLLSLKNRRNQQSTFYTSRSSLFTN